MTPPTIPAGVSPSEYAGSLGVDEDATYERLVTEFREPLRVLPPRAKSEMARSEIRDGIERDPSMMDLSSYHLT